MDRVASYREAGPHPALFEQIRCYYLVECEEPTRHEGLLVPDGHLELCFNLSGSQDVRAGDGWSETPRAYVDAVMPGAREVRWSGPIRFVGVKFQFASGAEMLGVVADDLRRDRIDASAIRGVGALSRDLRRAGDLRGAARRLDEFFLSRRAPRPADPLVEAAGAEIVAQTGTVRISTLAASLGVSRRTLELRVARRTGLTPKRLSRSVRTREAIRRVRSNPKRPLGAIASGLGYCDQSHFIREFRAATGRPPLRFFARDQFVAEFFERRGPS